MATQTRRAFLESLARTSAGVAALCAVPMTLLAAPKPRVLVIGAGLAGLRCALLLEDQGCEVTVIEGRPRIGGRLETLAHVPGRPEAGGSVLGRSYARMRAMAERCGAELATPAMGHGPKTGPCKSCHAQGKVPDRRGGPGQLIAWRGELVLESNWIDAVPGLSERERGVSPDRLMATYMQTANPLPDSEAWTRPEFAKFDDTSLEAYLKDLGATPTALQLMDVAPNCPGLARASSLWALRDGQRRAAAAGGLPLEFVGGSTAFVEKLAGLLGRRPITGKVVTAIGSGPDRIVVRCADGSSYDADYAISTLPLPVLARLRLDPAPPAAQAAAFREIGYTPITRVYYAVRRPFWEQDGLPVTMWTDSAIERVFPLRDDSGAVVALVSHADGPGAEALDALSERRRYRYAEQELARLRPATRGAVEAVATTSWTTDRFAGGAYPYYAPGQVGRLRPAVALPLGRLHFAGEHTAVTGPGMEGAAESADRAVGEVLARIGSVQPSG
ncbi:MAG: FAD-dependent oxidoreductase [Gammaproteobacteria bacterium]|nr:FAD-dependent oxidoreductase [Gammaproteobacteria bacterium]